MSKNIVFEGWLTKSPPTKRIWRTKWRRRWFALRQSGDLPGQYFLDYYADRNCRRLKGTINLDLCEQVDAGLHMERAGNGSVDPKLRGSVFTIQTQSRTYHLEADCEEDMEKWVDAICRVCGLRSTDDTDEEMRPYEMNSTPASPDSLHESADGTGPYIPISECITGVRALGRQTTTFTFDKNVVINAPLGRRPERNRYHYASQPHIRRHHAEVSENESNLSEDESNASSIRNNWYVTKSFTRLPSKTPNGTSDGPPVPPRPPKSLSLAAGRDSRDSRDNMFYMQRESYPGTRFHESLELNEHPARWLGIPRPVPDKPPHAPPSPARLRAPPAPLPNTDEADERETSATSAHAEHAARLLVIPRPVPDEPRHARLSPARLRVPLAPLPTTDEEDEEEASTAPARLSHLLGIPRHVPDKPRSASRSPARLRAPPAPLPTTDEEDEEEPSSAPASHYCNLPSLPPLLKSPPAVDRALKPRQPSIGHINHLIGHSLQLSAKDIKADVLQYLDLDLPASSQPHSKPQDAQKKLEVFHGKSQSCIDPDTESAYKTVDFLKTEAFNITRQDAEASRSNQH